MNIQLTINQSVSFFLNQRSVFVKIYEFKVLDKWKGSWTKENVQF